MLREKKKKNTHNCGPGKLRRNIQNVRRNCAFRHLYNIILGFVFFLFCALVMVPEDQIYAVSNSDQCSVLSAGQEQHQIVCHTFLVLMLKYC